MIVINIDKDKNYSYTKYFYLRIFVVALNDARVFRSSFCPILTTASNVILYHKYRLSYKVSIASL